MSSRDPIPVLRDILNAITSIERYTAGITYEEFLRDEMRTSAVERKLLTIAEAAVRLRGQDEALCPGMPWRNIRGLGNWIRHQYDEINMEIVWNTAAEDLPALKVSVTAAMQRLQAPEPPGLG